MVVTSHSDPRQKNINPKSAPVVDATKAINVIKSGETIKMYAICLTYGDNVPTVPIFSLGPVIQYSQMS